MGGLISKTNPGQAHRSPPSSPVTIMGAGPTGPVVDGLQQADSHLDSIFAGSGWTREDVMVVAALLQILAWVSLLYLEVSG